MKAKTIPVLFFIAAVLLAAAFFLSKNFFINNDKDFIRAKIITPVTSEGGDRESESYGHSMEAEKYETFVPLKSTETLISTLTMDFNNDSYDDEIIVVKKSGNSTLWIVPGIYNLETSKYDRLDEIPTDISRTRTFSYTGMDITGDHRNALIYQGDDDSGNYVMKIFLINDKENIQEVVTIGDFSSDGTIFVQQTERSESYELSLSKGESFSVWLYKSDVNEQSDDKKSSSMNQIQQEYKWNPMTERYEMAREIKVSAGRIAAKELSRIQDGTVETFAAFLNGLWYKTSNTDSTIRYMYFDYPNREIIQVRGDTQEVYEWEDSKLRHNGIYLTTVNSDIMNLHRRFDISLTNVDEIKITLRDDINLVIKEDNLWNGSYKKMTSQSSFTEKKLDASQETFRSELTKAKIWETADQQYSISFSDNKYHLTVNQIEETGVYSLMKAGTYDVIQFRSNTDSSMLQNNYVMNFGVKIITETVKRKTVEKQVTDYSSITFTPVKLTPTDCFAMDAKSFTFTSSVE